MKIIMIGQSHCVFIATVKPSFTVKYMVKVEGTGEFAVSH